MRGDPLGEIDVLGREHNVRQRSGLHESREQFLNKHFLCGRQRGDRLIGDEQPGPARKRASQRDTALVAFTEPVNGLVRKVFAADELQAQANLRFQIAVEFQMRRGGRDAPPSFC